MSELASYFWIAVAVLLLLVDLWAIVSVFRSEGWALLLIILPVVGLIIWGVAGPRGVKNPPSSPEHSKG